MSILKNPIFLGVAALLIVFLGWYAYQAYHLRIAHSTFENYYAFRGCQTLVDRTDTYGDCRLADGSTIKIVKYHDKWYLDGDLPWACITPDICIGL